MDTAQLKRIADAIEEILRLVKKDMEEKSNIVISDRLLYSNLAYQYKNEKFKLDRFNTGHLIDEKGVGTKTWIG